MSAHQAPEPAGLSEAVAAMGAALLKTLPSRRWVHERRVPAWGDMESFLADDGPEVPAGIDFTEMAA